MNYISFKSFESFFYVLPFPSFLYLFLTDGVFVFQDFLPYDLKPAFFPNKYFNSNFQTTILHCISFECNALAEKRRGDDIIAPRHFSFAPYFFSCV